MQRKFLSNLFLVLLLNVLVKPFYILGVDAEFLKRLEAAHPGEYGEYFSIVGLTFIFNIFLDLGLSNFNTREVARSENHQSEYFSSILSVKFLLIFIYMSLLFGSGMLLGYSDHQFRLLSFLGVNQVLVAFILFFRSNLSGMLKFRQDSIVSVLDRVLLVIMCSLVLWGGVLEQPLSIELFVWMQTVSYAVTLIVVVLLVLKSGSIPRIKVFREAIMPLLRKSLPYALLVLLMTIYYRTDSVMLEQMLPDGKREAALYAQGFRFLEAFSMIGFLFAGLLLPIFSKLIVEKKDVSDMVTLSFKLIFSIAFVLSMGVFFYAEEIIEARYEMTGAELIRSAASLQMLMICFIGMISTYIFGTLLTANGSLRILNWVAAVGVVLNLILNYFWIPEVGALGAAKASMITQLLTAIAQMVIAISVLKVKITTVDLVRLVGFALPLVGFAFFIDYDDWLFGLAAITTVGGGLAIISGVFNPREAIQILRSKE
ncbi:MAG: oligosaccharide flippase family protein [Flavobacteriales bacterium]|nr:oligosaccharide flippase family protein [Flavobacteriales bacterium]